MRLDGYYPHQNHNGYVYGLRNDWNQVTYNVFDEDGIWLRQVTIPPTKTLSTVGICTWDPVQKHVGGRWFWTAAQFRPAAAGEPYPKHLQLTDFFPDIQDWEINNYPILTTDFEPRLEGHLMTHDAKNIWVFIYGKTDVNPVWPGYPGTPVGAAFMPPVIYRLEFECDPLHWHKIADISDIDPTQPNEPTYLDGVFAVCKDYLVRGFSAPEFSDPRTSNVDARQYFPPKTFLSLINKDGEQC